MLQISGISGRVTGLDY